MRPPLRRLIVHTVWVIALLALAMIVDACVSSEEAGSGKKAGIPVASQEISEATRARVDSLNRADSIRARRMGFTSRHDTLVASVVRTSKPGARLIKPIERPADPAYTVQLGAFARTQHALRAQKLAKERFPGQPIFNAFEAYDKLYRVRVGKFDTWRQADSLRRSITKSYPNEYIDSWINYISK